MFGVKILIFVLYTVNTMYFNKVIFVKLLALVAIVIALGLVIFVINSTLIIPATSTGTEKTHTHDSSHGHDADNVYKVTYTETGFTPSRLEVPIGAIVEFDNRTDVAMWVGSDPHPKHTDYPEFDAREDYL